MTDDRLEEIVLKFTAAISELNANMKTTLEKLTNHEARLSILENETKKADSGSDFKEEMLKLLSKAVIISITTVASLVGAGGLIVKLFGLFGA